MNDHGRHKDGTPITDADVEAMADEAERGYDVDTLLRRRPGGRPPLGSAAASVESVRLDPELKRALLIRAAEEHVSVSEVIRRAIGEYLRASQPSLGARQNHSATGPRPPPTAQCSDMPTCHAASLPRKLRDVREPPLCMFDGAKMGLS